MEEPWLLSTVAEPDGRPAELECDHFSIMGYVALHQKKDPKLCSLGIFCNQQQYDEHNSNSSPLLVAKYQRWNCSNCLCRVKNSGHGTRSEIVPMQQDGTNADCSISIIRTLPYSAGSRRLFSCTRESSQGSGADQSNVSRSVQEWNLKCSSPSDNKEVTAVNVPDASIENNITDTFIEKSVQPQKGSPNNPQICVSDVDCNESTVHEPISDHKGSKSRSSGQKSNEVSNHGPRRNVGSDGKKKNSNSTVFADVSDLKFPRRKQKKTRLISKMFPPAISCDKNIENSTIKRRMLNTDDLGQVESEGIVQRSPTKVSLGKGKIHHNVSVLHKQNIPKNNKKCRLEVQTVIDDIPMDIVELLARKQHERQLMTDTDSTHPKIAAVKIADKDGPTDASMVLDTNFQKSLASGSKQTSLHGRASSSKEAVNVLLQNLHRQESSQCHATSSTEIPDGHRPELHMQNSLHVHALPITELRMPNILECTQQTDICRDEEVTIAYGASNDYATHQPVIAAIEGQYTKEPINQFQPTRAPSTSLTMEPMPTTHLLGHSGLYPKDPMAATHLLGPMDSSTSQGFTNYKNLGSQYAQHNQYSASCSTSHESHLTEKVQLTMQDLGRDQVEKDLRRPLRPHPRVGVFGPLLQQDIANWSESCGTDRTGNYETLRSGMFSAGWNALQLGSVTSVVNPEHPLPRYGVSQPCAGSIEKTSLDKLVRKDICQTNRNPADFIVISDENEYMTNL